MATSIPVPSAPCGVMVNLPADDVCERPAMVLRHAGGGVVDVSIIGGHLLDGVPYAGKPRAGVTSWRYRDKETGKLDVNDDGFVVVAAVLPAAA